jgi:hypothetical protein
LTSGPLKMGMNENYETEIAFRKAYVLNSSSIGKTNFEIGCPKNIHQSKLKNCSGMHHITGNDFIYSNK